MTTRYWIVLGAALSLAFVLFLYTGRSTPRLLPDAGSALADADLAVLRRPPEDDAS